MILDAHNDAIGNACLDYINTSQNTNIVVHSNIVEDDIIPTQYLFRSFAEMPDLEKQALTLATGKILDIGACAGSHSLFLQQQKKTVTAFEISKLCCDTMQKRGVSNIINANYYKFTPTEQYDTLLFLMNGVGIAGTVNNLDVFFKKADELLAPNGQILADSSDLRYLFEDDDGSILINLNDDYYGEIKYQMEYNNHKTKSFDWLFLDEEIFRHYANLNGFNFEIVAQGLHYDFLARLTRK